MDQSGTPLTTLRQQLRELWETLYPRRASGGRWALAGFALQSHIFLLHFFQGVVDGRVEPADLAEMEGISDILDPLNDILTLTQVKRTLGKEGLTSALEEAYCITKLCRENLPKALDNLHFQIVCRNRISDVSLADIKQTAILKGEADPDIWADMLARFHDNPIVEHLDYSDQLYLFLWNAGLRNPKPLVDKSLGRLLYAFEAMPSYDTKRLARELADIFSEAARRESWRPPGNVLSLKEVTEDPGANSMKGILTGQWVTLEHLRKGFVRRRPAVFDQLWKNFQGWHASLDTDEIEIREKIPVFWIAGRSGDGKSVLLLQLVQRLLQEHADQPVLHLPSGSRLPEFLENPPDGEQFSALALIDDVYDLIDREAWDERIRESSKLSIPKAALITCGPTEQRDQFQHNLNDVFDVHSFVAPQLAETEFDEFLDWYENRAGIRRNREELTSDNALLVQFVFELAQGERISVFAKKFQKRLEKLGLFASVRAIVAANALYQDAPPELLTDQPQQQALKRLCADDQLHFRITIDQDGNPLGIRLAHAHLSWLLFKEWIDPLVSPEQHWAQELAKSLEYHLLHKRVVSATSLLQQLLSTLRLADDNNTADLPKRNATIQELYRMHVEANSGEPHSGTLARWLDLIYKLPVLSLHPDPVVVAARLLRDEERSTSLHGSVAGWVWRIAAKRVGDEGDDLRTAAEWFFNNRSNQPGIAFALLKCSATADYPYASALIENWLTANHCLPEAYILLAAWLSKSCNTNAIAKQALCWLEDNPTHPHTYQLIEPLIAKRSDDKEILNIALRWLEDNPTHLQAYHVIAPLITKRGDDKEVLDVALRWFKDNPTHPHAYWLLAPLVTKRGDDEEVLDIALNWLEGNPTHPHAYQLIAPLVTKRDDDKEVLDIALSWLEDNPTHPHAYQLIAPLVTKRDDDKKVLDIALRWLEDNPTHPHTYQLIAPLITKRGDDKEILDIALSWLEGNPTHPHAYWLTKSLVTKRGDDEEVLDVALRWLEDNPTHPHAYQLIAPLVTKRGDDKEVLDVALRWLKDNPTHPHAYQLIAPLVTKRGDDKEVLDVALRWLKDNPTHPHAYWLIAPLVTKRGDDKEVLDVALRWLKDNPTHPQFNRVICPLIAKRPDDPVVLNFAKQWLNDKHSYLCHALVLGTLIANSRNCPEIIAMGENYLDSPNPQHPEQIIGALLYGGEAAPHHVKRTMQFIETLASRKQRDYLRGRLSIAIIHNPHVFLEYFQCGFDSKEKIELCRSAAHGLLKRPDLEESFLATVCPILDTEYTGWILSTAANLGTISEIVATQVGQWFVVNFRRPGYKTMLDALHKHPSSWERVVTITKKLKSDIIQDYKNLTPDKKTAVNTSHIPKEPQPLGALAAALFIALNKNHDLDS